MFSVSAEVARCLLLAGSNEPTDDRLQLALHSLRELGACEVYCARRLPPNSGLGEWYFNALIALDCDLAGDALRNRLKSIEWALGRHEAPPGRVVIDIDILAQHHDGWVADPRAEAKGEFLRGAAKTLLDLAGISVQPSRQPQ